MERLFLFVRPPRPLWPFNGTGSAFWPPLAFASMAAALREAIPDQAVAILDCPAERKGWKSFEAELRRLRPAYVGIGEEAVSCVEGLRAARIAKQFGSRVIAGGCFFGNVASEVLSTRLVDIVVHGEGEQTVVEVTQALNSGDHAVLRRIPGISFRDGDEIVFTGWRDPIRDIDSLPMPAFDLLPMHSYGRTSRNHPGLVALESSRGCPHECSFCVLWRQMGRYRASVPKACLRTKSPERLLDEIRYVTGRFQRRYIGWVDPCFNASPSVPREMSELLLSNGLAIPQSAWVRADYLCRDSQTGALSTCVESGLNEIYIGVERRTRSDLALLNKNCGTTDTERALDYIAENHPSVCTVGSFIFGVPGETQQSVRELIKEASRLPVDIMFFIPLTPLPGTPFWRAENWDGTGEVFSNCDFLPSGDDELSRVLLKTLLTYWPATRVRLLLRGWLSPDKRRRSITRRQWARAALFGVRTLLRPGGGELRFPSWYET